MITQKAIVSAVKNCLVKAGTTFRKDQLDAYKSAARKEKIETPDGFLKNFLKTQKVPKKIRLHFVMTPAFHTSLQKSVTMRYCRQDGFREFMKGSRKDCDRCREDPWRFGETTLNGSNNPKGFLRIRQNYLRPRLLLDRYPAVH